MNYKELFKEACYNKSVSKDIMALIVWLLDKGVDKSVVCGLTNNIAGDWCKSIGTTCRHCKEEIDPKDFDIHTSYWWQNWYPCHKNCRDVGMNEESRECHEIDADCNDCKLFVRGERIDKWSSRGFCSKHGRETLALINSPSCWPCFVHRKEK